MLKCKELARLVASDELEDARLATRLSVRLHLVMCRHCRRYAAQIRALGEAARRALSREDPGSNADAVERIKRSLLPSHD